MRLSDKKIQDLKKLKEQNSISNALENLYEKYLYTKNSGIAVDSVLKLLNEKICSFQDIVDKFKSIEDEDYYPCLYRLLENEELFKELIENNKLTQNGLRYMLYTIDDKSELISLGYNTLLLDYLIDNNTVSFQELVDKYKSIEDEDEDEDEPCLNRLLDNTEFFQELIENNKLTKEDLRYLLYRIDRPDELSSLCNNISLIKEILNEFVLDKDLIDRFNTVVENYWCKEHNIQTIFDWIEHCNRNTEILKLIELNKKLIELNKYINSFDLNEDQRLELAEILKDSEIAQNRLIQIVDNNLEDTYDFEPLKELLTKDDKKKKSKLNF